MKNTIATALFIAAGIALAAPAAANTDDTAYLTVLGKSGVTYETADSAIELGRAVCDGFNSDMSFEQVGGVLIGAGNMTPTNAGRLIGAAVAAYCPQHKDMFEN